MIRNRQLVPYFMVVMVAREIALFLWTGLLCIFSLPTRSFLNQPRITVIKNLTHTLVSIAAAKRLWSFDVSQALLYSVIYFMI